MPTVGDFRIALDNPNVQAFLKVVRNGEGTLDADGYRRCFGGQLFDSFQDHPRQKITKSLGSTPVTSTAAGAYQFLERTWDSLVQLWGFRDFSPTNQDLGAVALIYGRGALDDVVKGRLEQAISKCNKEWASLPGSPYGQPTVTLEKCREIYEWAGGSYEPRFAPAPVPDVVEDAPKPEAPPLTSGPDEVRMPIPAIAAAAIPALIEKLPELFNIFNAKGSTRERNQKLAVQVIDIAAQALGAKSTDEVVASMDRPDKVEIVREAIKGQWYELISEAGGGGIGGAREFNLKAAGGGSPFWKLPAFIVSAMLMPMIYFVVIYTLYSTNFTQETKATVIMAIISTLAAVTGFFLGSSFGSQKKDERPL